MLFHFYNFSMLPLDPYYKMILLFDGNNISLADHQTQASSGWEWWNLRIVPLWINWIVYKIVPCIQVNSIPEMVSQQTYCSIWSISLVNYASGILSQIGFFLLLKYKFKRPEGECILILFLSYFFINFLDRYGVDRLSLLFLVIFFLLETKEKISYALIGLSIFVNEKCTLLICSYFFLKHLNLSQLNLAFFNKKFLLSFALCLTYFWITFVNINEYFRENMRNIVDFNYLTFHSLSNSILPLLLISFPFLIYFTCNKVLKLFQLKQIYILLLLMFFMLGIFVGGTGNMGRYLAYLSVLFLPISNFLIYKIISNIDYFSSSPKYSKIEIIKMLRKH